MGDADALLNAGMGLPSARERARGGLEIEVHRRKHMKYQWVTYQGSICPLLLGFLKEGSMPVDNSLGISPNTNGGLPESSNSFSFYRTERALIARVESSNINWRSATTVRSISHL